MNVKEKCPPRSLAPKRAWVSAKFRTPRPAHSLNHPVSRLTRKSSPFWKSLFAAAPTMEAGGNIETPCFKKRPLKTLISSEVRQQVLELRRSHSLRKVAEQTGLSIGTVKTICSRSGAFRDNLEHRALFSLPPIQASTSTALEVPSLPPQEAVTGDHDLDAVLWLRAVIQTGQTALIEKAMRAAKRIKTPLPELEKRYMNHLVSKNPGDFTVIFKTMGFADLQGLAKSAVEKLAKQNEATARFGDALFANTPAEQFCIEALAGLECKGFFDEQEVDARYQARPELMPNTLSDCLHELAYWSALYWLRNSVESCDNAPEASARDAFVFRSLARIRARTKDEAIAVFRYLADDERMDDTETEAILLNLIGNTSA